MMVQAPNPQMTTANCARLELQFTTGIVRVFGQTVKLSKTEHALLFSIARHQHPSTREQLIDLVWGNGGAENVNNAFNVALHRLRRRLGGADAIVHTFSGYTLCDDAVVDIAHLEKLARAAKRAASFGDHELDSLRRVYEAWKRAPSFVSDRYDWLETSSHRARALAAELGVAVGRGVLQRGNVASALQVAEDLLADDRCDEPAAELAITALLRSGDRSAALRLYRRYADDLRRELDLRPSRHIKALLDESLPG